MWCTSMHSLRQHGIKQQPNMQLKINTVTIASLQLLACKIEKSAHPMSAINNPDKKATVPGNTFMFETTKYWQLGQTKTVGSEVKE